jgi:signal transduction histidine kinase/FixJ family two-component response regulator
VFDAIAFGAATTVGIALITQMGEQVDYLRFMPERTAANRWRWWAGVLVGGPGWVVPGVLKMLGGALLAYLAITHMVPPERAVDPNQMYLVAYEFVFSHYGLAVAATALFVIVSQLKINVTNAYAGSLAWSNFFSRLTHSHPGRVVWMVFNTAIALVLMELDVFQALGHVLGLYANIAIAWIMAVVADLVVNKPLGLSPPGIEFRRAHLYDVNPVGVGAMVLASLLSITAHLGWYGEAAQAYSAAIALVTAFVASPLLAWATGGRYYIARQPAAAGGAPVHGAPSGDAPGRYARLQPPARTQRCVICERDYETDDMAHCPAYQGAICSLCCTLDARCDDLCKPDAHLSAQWAALLRRLLPRRVWPTLDAGLGHWLLLMTIVAPALALLLGLLYHEGARSLADEVATSEAAAALLPLLRSSFVHVYLLLLVIGAVACWWLVLAHQTRRVAQEESNRQTQALLSEIASHRRTDEALQQAKLQAEAAQRAAEAANQAKSRYITTISHELRTPLNGILGYAQLLEADEAMPPARRHAVQVIRRGGDHLLSLIEGTLDIARIENGKLALDVRPMRFRDCLHEIAHLFELQAAGKGIGFACDLDAAPAVVRADEKRLRQILINLLGNAVKFTARGEVRLRLRYAHDSARFEIEDTGPGMSADELERVFEPFVRGSAAGDAASGSTGLGLTIAKMLTALMGGELSARSEVGRGTTFCVRLFLPELREAALAAAPAQAARTGYDGPRRRVLVVDNEDADRELVANVLQPLGFEVAHAASGEQCLEHVGRERPDAILMDLAMPGIDGWETIRRLRAAGFGDVPLAVVSANAFDRGLEHDVDLPPQDFIVKPVRLPELLDWLGRRLALPWRTAPAVTATPQETTPPDAGQLRALQRIVRSGHVRGILRELDAVEAATPHSAGYVVALRRMARDFQLDALARQLERDLARDTTTPHTP